MEVIKLEEDTSPKYTTRVLSTLHEHSGHKKATSSMINALINTKQLRSNLEMIDLRKIEIEDVKRISAEYEKESAKITGDISLLQVLPALGAYKIKDFDLSSFLGRVCGVRYSPHKANIVDRTLPNRHSLDSERSALR